MRSRLFRLLRAADLTVLLCSGVFASGQQYSIQDLGALPDYPVSAARGLNGNGSVVGDVDTTSGRGRAFVWNAASGMAPLFTDDAKEETHAVSVNDAGVIAGSRRPMLDLQRAFRWGNGVTELLSRGDTSRSSGLNAAGDVSGCYMVGGAPHAFVWRSGGDVIDVPTLPGALAGNCAEAVNDSGIVVGTSDTAERVDAGFVWSADGGPRRMLPKERDGNGAYAINNRGDVAGFVWSGRSRMKAVVVNANGKERTYALNNGGNSAAYGINDAGDAVGESCGRAVLMREGRTLDLNLLVPTNPGRTLTVAYAINNQGVIVGVGTIGGSAHAFRLIPIN